MAVAPPRRPDADGRLNRLYQVFAPLVFSFAASLFERSTRAQTCGPTVKKLAGVFERCQTQRGSGCHGPLTAKAAAKMV